VVHWTQKYDQGVHEDYKLYPIAYTAYMMTVTKEA